MWSSNAFISYFGRMVALGKAVSGFVNFLAVFEEQRGW